MLLLEAGGDNRLNETQSGWQGIDLQGGVFDWQFKTTPQEGTDGRVHDQPRGLLLGGCSSTNTVLHVRAPSGDYQRWEALYGCDGWGWPDMERCYKKMERFHPASADSAELSYHGEDGAIGVTQLGEKTAQAYITQTIQAFNNSGLGFNKDYNGSEMRGFSYAQLTVENGTRCDAFTGYLRRRGLNGKRPLDRPNLAVVRNAFVTKVVLDGKKAVGVSVRFAQEAGGFAKLATGPDVFIPATTEVILSAGAIGSPWLLQLSGIGPKDVLEEAGIPVQLAQEQVGRNLKDHLFVPLVWEFDDKDGLTTAPTLRMLGHLLRYVFTRTGPFSTGFIEAMGFADSGLTDEETGLAWAKRPDIQVGPFSVRKHQLKSRLTSFGRSLSRQLSSGARHREERLFSWSLLSTRRRTTASRYFLLSWCLEVPDSSRLSLPTPLFARVSILDIFKIRRTWKS